MGDTVKSENVISIGDQVKNYFSKHVIEIEPGVTVQRATHVDVGYDEGLIVGAKDTALALIPWEGVEAFAQVLLDEKKLRDERIST